MKINNSSNIAEFIEEFTKAVACLLIALAIVFLISLLSSGKILDPKYQNSVAYKLCCHLVGDHMVEIASAKIESEKEALDHSIAESINNASLDTLQGISSLIDITQNEAQVNMSNEISRTVKIIEDLSGERAKVTGWVYAGSFDNIACAWNTKYFDFLVLEIGETYKTTSALNIRSSQPSKASGTWQKGRVVGGLREGDQFEVIGIEKIPGKNNTTLYWLEIILMN